MSYTYSEKAIRDALIILPHLIRAAQLNQVISYKQLCTHLTRTPTSIGHPLGYIRDVICIPKGLPRINAIAVNATTGLPGDSFLPEGTEHLSHEAYVQAFQNQRDEAFAYNGWEALLAELGLEPLPTTPQQLEDEGRAYIAYEERRDLPGEGIDHQQLKLYVAANPHLLGLETHQHGITEHLFLSGDRCDVIFDLKTSHAVAEIKNGFRGELVKGIHQAIKYRALMIAEKGHGVEYPVRAFLVAYQIPKDINDYAEKYNIRCVVIDRTRVLKGTNIE